MNTVFSGQVQPVTAIGLHFFFLVGEGDYLLFFEEFSWNKDVMA